jgi:hypothetical protein
MLTQRVDSCGMLHPVRVAGHAASDAALRSRMQQFLAKKVSTSLVWRMVTDETMIRHTESAVSASFYYTLGAPTARNSHVTDVTDVTDVLASPKTLWQKTAFAV